MTINSRDLSAVLSDFGPQTTEADLRRGLLDMATQVDENQIQSPDLTVYSTTAQMTSAIGILRTEITTTFDTSDEVDAKDLLIRQFVTTNYLTSTEIAAEYYLRSEVDTLLSNVNVDPTTVQSDWDSVDTTSARYVRNKPDPALIVQKALPDNDNLNGVIIPGDYTFGNVSNSPFGANGALRVIYTRAGVTTHIRQDAWRDESESPHSHFRVTSNGGNSWGGWQEHNTGDLNVNADWTNTNPGDHAYIEHKPTIPPVLTAGTGIAISGSVISATGGGGGGGGGDTIEIGGVSVTEYFSADVELSQQTFVGTGLIVPENERSGYWRINTGQDRPHNLDKHNANWHLVDVADLFALGTLEPGNLASVQNNDEYFGIEAAFEAGYRLHLAHSPAGELLVATEPNQGADLLPLTIRREIYSADAAAAALTGGEGITIQGTEIRANRATVSVPGISELATPTETVTGDADDKVVTPEGVKTAIDTRVNDLNLGEDNIKPDWDADVGDPAEILNKPDIQIPTIPPALTAGEGIDIVSGEIRVEEATTTNIGASQLATDEEAADGSSETKVISPAALKFVTDNLPVGGGGGSGSFATGEIFNDNVDITSGNNWKEIDFTVSLANRTGWWMINFGGSDTSGNRVSGAWHWVNVEQLFARADGVHNTTRLTSQFLSFGAAIHNGEETGYIGHDSSGKILVGTSSSQRELYPFRIHKVA